MNRRIRLICHCACLVLAVLFFASTAYASWTISPDADSFTRKNRATTNYGTLDIIEVKAQSDSAARYGWLQFTFGATAVPSAELWLYQMGHTGGTAQHGLRLRGEPGTFSETGITWSNQPGGETLNWATFIAGPYDWSVLYEGWRTIDITSFYNNNRGQTVRLRLRCESQVENVGLTFYSREYEDPALRPFIAIPEPGSFAVLAFGMASAGGMLIRRRRR